ncbi:phosphopantetheine-binding protein [Sandaracinus amylolyticus]|uniref:Acyl carrier protein n=1 Tax=Sandaracinus amylolyticus TaxID=927083 RepID=A0A0F6W0K6_9BACT|nr:phosphopantetheine-binding protein [Sandaracinus amylolyticus]AKF04177.1 acyl carrier protein [Sandaracinus amylolyticus]
MKNSERIERYVLSDLARGRARGTIGPNDDLIEAGILDSLSIVHLIRYLEQAFDIEVRDEDIVPESFRTLAGIDALVERLTARTRVA